MTLASQRGAVGISLLALLPLLIASTALGAAVFLVLKAHAGALHDCRLGLLDVENTRLSRLRELMGLNGQASRLRRKRAAAELKFKAAAASGFPPAVAVAKANLEAVRARQMLLRQHQKSLLARARIETESRLARLRTKIGSRLAAGSAADIRPSIQWNPLSVQRQPANDLTPDFSPSARFEERQAIRVSWGFRPAKLLPNWLGFGEFETFKLEARCGSTAERKTKNTWRARLDADRP